MNPSKRGVLVAAAVAMIALLSQAAGAAVASPSGADPTDRTFYVTARQWAYEPSLIEVNQGDNVTIILQSADVAHSAISIEGYTIKQTLFFQVGKPAVVVINFIADKPGTFVIKCALPCGPFHPFMTGTLKVDPNYPFEGAGASAAALTVVVSLFLFFRRA